MSLHQDIKKQMIEALKAKDTLRLNVIRGLLSAFTNEAVSKKRKPDEVLSDEEALVVISRAVKQRKDSIEQFEKGGRPELAEVEKSELAILGTYLPTQMSREEVVVFIKKKQVELNMDKSKKGQFMGIIMKDLKGQADGSMVKEIIDSLFS
ncbi:MAG: glutamyl-tRNA amidotransferase [Candidatus Zambryskibacteria bacterium CG22_combo_CG10-13_8_21_14_all_42_17]|uniref:Glutamyl-tRNA amidotransferase n=1 Tax=Candidatus Zambryskibacteria bacterium CG22_combo_CG10-13_8_21_14_all_42_17 TaxID=1975118 RepID=A0A2H0BCP1_9BACT|nr:MAG: glutamyl-tRNA amidotransferase [Candidatus Zambryskibacteria bacterium CG22_combo_CG10-13_8_21_14_all_42_17]